MENGRVVVYEGPVEESRRVVEGELREWEQEESSVEERSHVGKRKDRVCIFCLSLSILGGGG